MRQGPDHPHLQAQKTLREVSHHQPAPTRCENYPNAGPDMPLRPSGTLLNKNTAVVKWSLFCFYSSYTLHIQLTRSVTTDILFGYSVSHAEDTFKQRLKEKRKGGLPSM